MNKSHKLKLFGMVAILTVALIFIGVNFLDADRPADKPPKPDKPGKPDKEPGPEYIWQVVIPGEELAFAAGYNLFGLTPYTSEYPGVAGFIYEDKGLGDGFYVEVKKKGRGKRAEWHFKLAVFNNRGEFGCNTPWPDKLGARKTGFQNIAATFLNYAPTAAEEYPCFFPSLTDPPYPAYPLYPCDDPDHGYDYAPDCMADFLNGLHPYCDGPHPEYSYDYVYIIITVDYDIEKIGSTPVYPTGVVWVDVVNTYELQTGCEYPHNISGVLRRDVSEGCIEIVRNGDDEWTIKVINGLFTFTEIYKGTWRNRWEYKIPYWAQIPLTFETTWTRQPVE